MNSITACPAQQCYGDSSCCFATGYCVGSSQNLCLETLQCDINAYTTKSCGTAPGGVFYQE